MTQAAIGEAEKQKQKENLRRNVAAATHSADGRIIFQGLGGQHQYPTLRKAEPTIGAVMLAGGVGMILACLVHGSGNDWFSTYGLPGIFALGGYATLCQRNIFIVDTAVGTWHSERGVWPFVRREAGLMSALAGIEAVHLTRTSNDETGETYDVWAVRVRWQESRHAPLELRSLDIPTSVARRAFALEQYGLLASESYPSSESYQSPFTTALIQKAEQVMNKIWNGMMFFFGTVFILAGLAQAIIAVRFDQHAVSTQGKIVSVITTHETDSIAYAPVIAFTTQGNRLVHFEGNAENSQPPIGQKVPVLYDPSNPSDACIDRLMERWWATMVFLPVGLLVVTGMSVVIQRQRWTADRTVSAAE